MTKWDLFLECKGWFNMEKSINVINYISRMKGKNMVISIDTEKAFEKILYSFQIKTLGKLGIKVKYPNIIKIMYENTANIRLNGKSLKTFSLRLGA